MTIGIQAAGTPESNRQIIDWTRGSPAPAHMGDMDGCHDVLYLSSARGDERIEPGDWVTLGVGGFCVRKANWRDV